MSLELCREAYELPQIQQVPPSGKLKGTFGIRFTDQFDFTSQYVHLTENEIKIFIPFTGPEKKCWNCGGNRELLVITDLEGNFKRAEEACDKPRIFH